VAAQVAVHRPAALGDAIIRQGSVGCPEVEAGFAAEALTLDALLAVKIIENVFTLKCDTKNCGIYGRQGEVSFAFYALILETLDAVGIVEQRNTLVSHTVLRPT